MRVKTLYRKVQRNYEDYGLRVTLGKSLACLLMPFFERTVYRIYRADLDQPCPPIEPPDPDLEFQLLNVNDEAAIGEIEELTEWLHGSLRARMAGGDLCLVARSRKRVAGFNLVSAGEITIPLLRLKRRFRGGFAWSSQIFVSQNHRRQRLSLQLRYRIFRELQARSVRRLYGGTLASNVAALKAARKAGFTEVADIRYCRILRRRTWRCKRVRPECR